MPDAPEKKQKGLSTQQFVPIKEVREGIVVMKDGSLRSVIMVSSLNFALKSEEEKDGIIFSFQNFINSLDFPIQITVRSRKLHLDNYIANLKEMLNKQTNELLKLQTSEYIAFIAEMLNYADIMEKRFFVVVPYYPGGKQQAGFIKNLLAPSNSATSDFETSRIELQQRVDHVIQSLGSVGLRCVALNTEDLIELYYTVYNPDTAGEEKLKNIDSLDSAIISEAPDAR